MVNAAGEVFDWTAPECIQIRYVRRHQGGGLKLIPNTSEVLKIICSFVARFPSLGLAGPADCVTSAALAAALCANKSNMSRPLGDQLSRRCAPCCTTLRFAKVMLWGILPLVPQTGRARLSKAGNDA